MDCREFEQELEALAAGHLPAARRSACSSHASRCAECSELLRLLELPIPETPPSSGLVEAVLEGTVGSACGQAHDRLCAHVDGELEEAAAELMDVHLERCSDCRALASVLRRLDTELPKLAELPPDERFVADVLAATLPVPVRLRRWWRGVWPTLVRRPRFALEGAYVGLLVLVLVLVTAGAPVEAMPQRAIELTRSQPERIEGAVAELGERLGSTVAVVKSSEALSLLDERRRAVRERVAQAKALWTDAKEAVGTLWEEAASLLEKDDLEPSPKSNETDEE